VTPVGVYPYPKQPGSALDILLTVLKARYKTIWRYKGALVAEIFFPVIFAALPILLGVAVAGNQELAAANFKNSSGTEQFKLYLLLGANTFVVVETMMWVVGYWTRQEQETGTLESVYLAPANRYLVLTGVTLYALIRALMNFSLGLLVGSLLFGVNPLSGNFLLAVGFVLLGMLPMWGISFAFGAIILRLKEANSIISLSTWVVSFFMGIFFPVKILSPLIYYVALGFPPTWMANGVRASLLDVSFFLGTWYLDLTVLLAFALVFPVLGYAFFLSTERRLKSKEGLGAF